MLGERRRQRQRPSRLLGSVTRLHILLIGVVSCGLIMSAVFILPGGFLSPTKISAFQRSQVSVAVLHQNGQSGVVSYTAKVLSWSPRVVFFPKLFSPEECSWALQTLVQVSKLFPPRRRKEDSVVLLSPKVLSESQQSLHQQLMNTFLFHSCAPKCLKRI